MARVGIKAAVKAAKAEERAAVRKVPKTWATKDSLQNFAANLGVGTDNLSSYTGYGFNPISRVRILIEWIYRGSWIGGMAVNVVADDMTRAGVDIRGQVKPEDIEHLERAATTLNLWPQIANAIKWARLYGGAICVPLIDGQNMSTPLRIETVGKGQFKGLMVFDRWMLDPSLNELVTEVGPYMGTPKYYSVVADSPAYRRQKIHYSRCLRLLGVELPFYQAMMENLWGISVLERLYDRLIAFDSATQGVAQLLFKAYLRVLKIDNMRETVGAGGQAEQNLYAWVDVMRRYQSIEGITLIDAKDDATAMPPPSFAGLGDAMVQLGQQLGGALGIPLIRLFGQSPIGMNATGESDLRTYYDNIKQQQMQTLLVPLTRIYRIMAQSEGIKLPEGFSLDFKSLWLNSDETKADINAKVTSAVNEANNLGYVSDKRAAMELRQSSNITGYWTNLDDKYIDKLSDEPRSTMQDEMMKSQMEMGQEQHERAGEEHDLSMEAAASETEGAKANGKAKTSATQ